MSPFGDTGGRSPCQTFRHAAVFQSPGNRHGKPWYNSPMLTEHLVTIRAACDRLGSGLFDLEQDRVRLTAAADQLAAERSVLAARVEALEAELAGVGPPPRLIFADELDRPPLRLSSWNVDAPQNSLTPQTVDGRAATRFTIDRTQPLNPQGRCKTEVGPRDTDKSTASYLRLPQETPLRVELELHVPQTWLRYRHKFNLAEVHGDTLGKPPPVSLYLSGDRMALRVGTSDAWSAQRPAGWCALQFDLLLSADPQRARTQFWMDGVKLADASSTPNAVGLPFFKFGLYAPSWSEPERQTADLSGPVNSEFVHYRRFRLWQM